jgi:hypothetical protein
MTPKEKAENLIDRYLMVRNEFNETLYFSEAKHCALVTVDEILSVIWNNQQDVDYWQQVKQEIENL